MGPRKLNELVERIAGLDAAIRTHEEHARRLRADLATARDELRPEMPFDERVLAAGYLIWRTRIAPIERFSLKEMREAGAKLPATLTRFVHPGDEGERWFLKPAQDKKPAAKQDATMKSAPQAAART
jgi:hypothetical protein